MGGLEIIRQRLLVFEAQPIWIRSFQKLFNMANTFFALRDSAAAIDIYKKSIALKPEFAPAVNNLGAAHLKAGQISEAFHSFVRASRLNPQHEEAFANLYN